MSNSWTSPPFDDDEAYEALCANSTPEDFYFDVRDFGGCTTVNIVPKAFFDKECYMLDQHIAIEHILPEHLFEEMECIYATENSVEDTKEELLDLGFLECAKFSDLLSEAGE